MFGFLNLNKPKGITSHDCVVRVRRLLQLKKVGHGGTLDPAATGVLPIAVGKATRLLQFLPTNKAYRAKIRFGVRTTTDDLEGEILQQCPGHDLSLEAIESLLPQFLGQVEQIPPIYSAIQKDGKRLYELARRGETVEVPKRTVEIFKIEVLGWYPGEFPELDLAIACGSGTYIRAIARDLGNLLEVGATLAQLIRTESCSLHLDQSLTFEDLENQLEQKTFALIPPEQLLTNLDFITLCSEEALKWCQGQKQIKPIANFSALPSLEKFNFQPTIPLGIYHEDGHFLGITEAVKQDTELFLVPKIVLVND
jgi:tRNA pseudouridine55 synthase